MGNRKTCRGWYAQLYLFIYLLLWNEIFLNNFRVVYDDDDDDGGWLVSWFSCFISGLTIIMFNFCFFFFFGFRRHFVMHIHVYIDKIYYGKSCRIVKWKDWLCSFYYTVHPVYIGALSINTIDLLNQNI